MGYGSLCYTGPTVQHRELYYLLFILVTYFEYSTQYVYGNPQFLIYTPVPLWPLLSLSSVSVSLFLFCSRLNVLCTIQRTFALLLTFKSYWGYILLRDKFLHKITRIYILLMTSGQKNQLKSRNDRLVCVCVCEWHTDLTGEGMR